MAELTELNRAHFDNTASTYNSRRQNANDQVLQELRDHRAWIGIDWLDDDSDLASDDSKDEEDESSRSLRLLDYACGTGMVSKAFAPYVSETVGIDLSARMVEEYNRTVLNNGISPEEMYAVQGNLIDPASEEPLSSAKFFDFDIAVISLSLHHIADPAEITRKVVERLKPSGTLVVLDFAPHGAHLQSTGGSSSTADSNDVSLKTVAHHGFAEAECKRVFEYAGAAMDFEYLLLQKTISHPRHKHGHDHAHVGHDHHARAAIDTDSGRENPVEKRKIFLAKGKKQ